MQALWPTPFQVTELSLQQEEAFPGPGLLSGVPGRVSCFWQGRASCGGPRGLHSLTGGGPGRALGAEITVLGSAGEWGADNPSREEVQPGFQRSPSAVLSLPSLLLSQFSNKTLSPLCSTLPLNSLPSPATCQATQGRLGLSLRSLRVQGVQCWRGKGGLSPRNLSTAARSQVTVWLGSIHTEPLSEENRGSVSSGFRKFRA